LGAYAADFRPIFRENELWKGIGKGVNIKQSLEGIPSYVRPFQKIFDFGDILPFKHLSTGLIGARNDAVGQPLAVHGGRLALQYATEHGIFFNVLDYGLRKQVVGTPNRDEAAPFRFALWTGGLGRRLRTGITRAAAPTYRGV
jgi:hypothetical protein